MPSTPGYLKLHDKMNFGNTIKVTHLKRKITLDFPGGANHISLLSRVLSLFKSKRDGRYRRGGQRASKYECVTCCCMFVDGESIIARNAGLLRELRAFLTLYEEPGTRDLQPHGIKFLWQPE